MKNVTSRNPNKADYVAAYRRHFKFPIRVTKVRENRDLVQAHILKNQGGMK